jgi:ABC-type transporter Mla maintaining outer membrane lipid asymmetry ATPase subunit MlaF
VSLPALDIAALVKDYRGLRPLRLQRLTLEAGAQLAILGFDEPTAEMMTTLITGAAVPDAGVLRVLGTSTADIADSTQWLELVDRIGIVTNRAALLDGLSVIQNLAMPFTLDIEPPPADVRERAARLASEAGLPSASWERPVGDLAGDLRARLRIARAVSLDPALILMEHPTADVPRDAVRHLASDVKQVIERRGIAALTLTADEMFAENVSQQVVTWDPASGALRVHRRAWRPWRH